MDSLHVFATYYASQTERSYIYCTILDKWLSAQNEVNANVVSIKTNTMFVILCL